MPGDVRHRHVAAQAEGADVGDVLVGGGHLREEERIAPGETHQAPGPGRPRLVLDVEVPVAGPALARGAEDPCGTSPIWVPERWKSAWVIGMSARTAATAATAAIGDQRRTTTRATGSNGDGNAARSFEHGGHSSRECLQASSAVAAPA